MEIRHAISPLEFKSLDTDSTRKQFLVEDLFVPDEKKLIYSHIDRIIVGGVCPAEKSLGLEGGKEMGSEFFLERRELGVINVGQAGVVAVDGNEHQLQYKEGLYVGAGNREITFSSSDPDNPAKFYLNSATAHKAFPTMRVTAENAKQIKLGSREESNKRTIFQFIHPDVLESCQLCMGMTVLEPGCVWNTMPCHTHDRRMEVYFYFEMDENSLVFHQMGEPSETRHIITRNEEAVISPSWSIHSGVGTRNYTFIWGMVGENQTFTDMDHVDMSKLL
ncbi:MAG: 5-dehydro-4-deoxy-D-glucuronate isomerase [Proteobacteria bacterium]|nr:5-dehydro-4-deoxy-D-glucuronate isomerase [Pseudomonadota bacterium]